MPRNATADRVPPFDRALWFYHRRCSGRHYLLGHAHTFPGSVAAWCPRQGLRLYVTREEMGRMSGAADCWFAGFLHGSEPSPPVPLPGRARVGWQRQRRWSRLVAAFRRTGHWDREG